MQVAQDRQAGLGVGDPQEAALTLGQVEAAEESAAAEGEEVAALRERRLAHGAADDRHVGEVAEAVGQLAGDGELRLHLVRAGAAAVRAVEGGDAAGVGHVEPEAALGVPVGGVQVQPVVQAVEPGPLRPLGVGAALAGERQEVVRVAREALGVADRR